MTTKLRLHLIRIRVLIAGLLALTAILISGGPVRADDEDSRPRFNRPGNIVIADQFNNRAIEVDPDTHEIVRQFALFGEAESQCRRIV